MMYKKEKNSRCLEDTEEFFCIQQISNLFVEHEHTNIENKKNVLEMGIEELDLEVRSYNCLKRADIHTIGDLICKTEKELIKVKYMQKRCLEEIQCQLAKLGLALRSSDG